MNIHFYNPRVVTVWQTLRLIALVLALAGGVFRLVELAGWRPMANLGLWALAALAVLWGILMFVTLGLPRNPEAAPDGLAEQDSAADSLRKGAALLMGLGTAAALVGVRMYFFGAGFAPQLLIVGGLAALLSLFAYQEPRVRLPSIRFEAVAVVLVSAVLLTGTYTGWF